MKKNILSLCMLVILSLLYLSCSKEDIQPNKKEGTVEFGFSLKAPLHGSAQKSIMMAEAEPAAVVVSIKRANGNSVYSMQKVELYNMNGYYISKPLSLLPGNYTVDQFFIVDASSNVIYASPLQGSPKAYLVSKPLPISFTIGKDIVTKIVPEVLSAASSTPEDFGYSTFSFDVVKSFDFLISVFTYNESLTNFQMTTSNLSITAVSKTIYSGILAAITNKVSVNDGYDNYILSVTKDGYKPWVDTLTAAELKLHLRSEDKGPLVVILEKSVLVPQVKYGRLYNWNAATDKRNIASIGWKVPKASDFNTLITYLGGNNIAGGKLKETGITYWIKPNTGSTNEVFFNSRAAGFREGELGSAPAEFASFSVLFICWVDELTHTYFQNVSYDNTANVVEYSYSLKRGYSLRLIKEITTLNNGQTGSYIGNDGKVYRTICIGTQEWIADNLAETKYRNGDIIPEVTDNAAWAALNTGAWCAFNNDHSNI